MPARKVVDLLDVIKQIGACSLSSSIDLPGYAFGLGLAEETLHGRVVPDPASPNHAAANALLLKAIAGSAR